MTPNLPVSAPVPAAGGDTAAPTSGALRRGGVHHFPCLCCGAAADAACVSLLSGLPIAVVHIGRGAAPPSVRAT